MFAVVVTLKIEEGAMAAFLPAIKDNARTSLAEESGCRHFDVCTDSDRPNEVFLYELYTDRVAFVAHLESTHFKVFDRRVAPMVSEKDIRTYAEVAP